MYNFEYCSQKLKYEKGEPELCLKRYSVKGVIDLEIVDLTLIIMPQPYNSQKPEKFQILIFTEQISDDKTFRS